MRTSEPFVSTRAVDALAVDVGAVERALVDDLEGEASLRVISA